MSGQQPEHPGRQPPAGWPAYPGVQPPQPHRSAPWPYHPPPVPVPARSYGWVWGLAAALALMLAVALGTGAWALTAGPDSYGDDPRLDRLWDACERGDMGACDVLYYESPLFSAYEEFGFTCGGRRTTSLECAG